jgi:uncharacterized membrane protein
VLSRLRTRLDAVAAATGGGPGLAPWRLAAAVALGAGAFTLFHALPGLPRDHPGQTFALIALVAALAGALAHAAPPPRPAATAWPAALAVAALGLGYALFFARLAILNHHALNTRALSLGLYDNLFYRSSHGDPLGCSFVKTGYHGSAHFDPILVLLAPLYRLYPRAELLLGLQAAWLGAGVWPVYLLARAHRRGRAAAVALAAMYALHPALHGATMYEFHSLTLVAPLTLWLLWSLETGRTRTYFALLVAALLVREDVAFLMAFVGLYALLARRPALGLATIAASVAYFLIVKRWFMTSPEIFMTGQDAYSYAFNYEDLIPHHDGARGMLRTLATRPGLVLRTVLTEAKVLYLLGLFLPLAFLPLLARPGRVMLVWGLLFSLLATRPALFSLHFHYPCLILPVAFALAPAGLRRVEQARWPAALGLDGARVGRAALVFAFVASVLVSWKLGGLVENATFRAGYLPVARRLDEGERARYAWLRDQIERIPADARVGVTNRTGPHASSRMTATFYPERTDVDWLVLDEADLRGAALERHREQLRAGTFERVASRDDLAIYRRRASPPAGAP